MKGERFQGVKKLSASDKRRRVAGTVHPVDIVFSGNPQDYISNRLDNLI